MVGCYPGREGKAGFPEAGIQARFFGQEDVVVGRGVLPEMVGQGRVGWTVCYSRVSRRTWEKC
jgi:hypothetical protein